MSRGHVGVNQGSKRGVEGGLTGVKGGQKGSVNDKFGANLHKK